MKGETLKRELGLLGIFCIASGAMVSSGLFILPSLAFAKAGPAAILSYLLAGMLMIPAVLATAELATAMPRAGGSYFFIERSLGTLTGTLGGLANWFSIAFKSAFALVGIGAFLQLIYPDVSYTQVRLIAVGSCLLFTFINLTSVKITGRLQISLVLLLLGILVSYVFYGLQAVHPPRYFPFMPFGSKTMLAVTGLVFISYGGLTKVASVGEEVKNPGRNIPLGIFSAFVIINLLYVLVVGVTVGVLDAQQLKSSLTPICLGASTFMGAFGAVIVAVAAMCAFVTTANAGILAASRNPLAMSRDGVLPKFLGKVSKRFGTPYVSIFLTSAFMVVVILFLTLEELVKTASTLMLLLFILVNLSVIMMRAAKISSYRPKFRSPLCPWIQLLGIAAYGFLIFEMGSVPLAITGGFMGLGAVWYLSYVRPNVKRQSALMHVVERVTAKELVTGGLEDELRDILIERDNIIEDRFDRLVKGCAILDVKGPLPLEKFFQKAAEVLSPRVGIEPKRLFELLMERERQSTTAIHPGLAVPHIIIEGSGKFDLLLARCEEGVSFSPSLSPVHTAFILVGTPDERNFHLRALMAIAQITQEPGFEKNWLNARGPEELRNILLTSNRRRTPGK